MPRMKSSLLWWIPLVVFVPMILALSGSRTPRKSIHKVTTALSVPAVTTAESDGVSRLRHSGWDEESATVILAFHGEWFRAIEQDDPKMARTMWMAIDRLGNESGIHAFIREHPEILGLMCVDHQPQELIDILRQDPASYPVLLSILTLTSLLDHYEPARHALRDHSQVIVRLYRQGIVGSERLFTGGNSSEERAFDHWLDRALSDSLTRTNEELAELIAVVWEHRAHILERMRKSTAFRDRFEVELWPSLCRITAREGNPIEAYLDSPFLWDVLSRPDGERLLAKWGLLAVALLYGSDAYPPELHDRVAEILLTGDDVTFYGLAEGKFRHDERYEQILKSRLSRQQLAGIINYLMGEDKSVEARLAEVYRVRDREEELAKLLVPPQPSVFEWIPFYLQFNIARKLIVDERISAEEWQDGGEDALLTLVPFGKAGKVLRQAVKTAEKAPLTRKLGKAAVANLPKKMEIHPQQIRRWTSTTIVRTLREKRNDISDAMGVNITSLVQSAYARSGIGVETWKRLTSLDARVFMRRDAIVVVQLDKLALQKAKESMQRQLLEVITKPLETIPREQIEQIQTHNAAAIFWLRHGNQFSPVSEGDLK